MKLEDVKKQIDEYFDKITPQELYSKLKIYGFKECDNEEYKEYILKISNGELETSKKNYINELSKRIYKKT